MEVRKKELEKFGILVVSEFGIYSYEDINFMINVGVNVVLVGEFLVKKINLGIVLL